QGVRRTIACSSSSARLREPAGELPKLVGDVVPRCLVLDPPVRDRLPVVTAIDAAGPEEHRVGRFPRACQLRAAAAAEPAALSGRGLEGTTMLVARGPPKAGDRKDRRERGAVRLPTHPTMTMHHRRGWSLRLVTNRAAEATPFDHSFLLRAHGGARETSAIRARGARRARPPAPGGTPRCRETTRALPGRAIPRNIACTPRAVPGRARSPHRRTP